MDQGDHEISGTPELLFQDLTEKRKMEHSLAQSSKLEAIGRLTGGIAHDFNNVLTGVTGNLSMLEVELQEGRPTNDLLEYAQGASTAADHAASACAYLYRNGSRCAQGKGLKA